VRSFAVQCICREYDAFQSANVTTWKRPSGGNCAVDACYRLADDIVTGQRKTLVVLCVVVVIVFGALSGLMLCLSGLMLCLIWTDTLSGLMLCLSGLMLGFTLLEQISLHAGGTTLDTQQSGSLLS